MPAASATAAPHDDCDTAPVPGALPSAPPPDRAVRLALDRIAGLPDLPMRAAPLAVCHDRVLAERVRAEADMPPRDSAAVDGYAFAGAACRGPGPWRLRLTGRLAVARNLALDNAFPAREAVRIAAGASIPVPLDRVVAEGDARREGDYIVLDALPDAVAAIQPRGSAALCGEVIADSHRLLDARDIAGLAGIRRASVKVRRTLRVAVLAVGANRQDVPASAALLLAALDRRWIARTDLGTVASGALAGTLRSAATNADAILAIDRAGLDNAIETAGGRFVLEGIAMRPGGGVRLALLGETVVIVVPPAPVDAMTAMAILGWPMLRRRAGIARSRAVPRAGIAAFSLPADPACADYPLVRIAGTGSVPTLETVTESDGGMMTRLALADGIALPAPGEAVGFGARIAWVPITDRFT